MISALHRLHLLVHFEYIYVIHNGRIAEQGCLEYLKQHGSLFRDLWSHQETEK